MNDRKIKLAFDEKKQAIRAIRTEISQKLFISLILFWIYIRFLFSKIKNKHKYANIKMSSFIDDVAIEIKFKNAKENCKLLTEIVEKVFSWTNRNAIKFDDEKSELIHFESSNNSSIDTVKLSNNTILKSKINVKWLKIYMNRKLNFKKRDYSYISLWLAIFSHMIIRILFSYVIKKASEDSALYTSKYRLNFRIFQWFFDFIRVF